MIPLRDTLTLQRTPWINLGLLTALIVIFIAEIFAAARMEEWINLLGFIPARFFQPSAFGFAPWESLLTLLTSIMLHGGFVHIVGNLVFLAIFGNDVEDRAGSLVYLGCFFAAGAVGSITHAFLQPSSLIPSIGASGSIAGVLGMFAVLHPRAKIVTLIPIVISWVIVEIPAIVFLPIWFALQFLNGTLALAAAAGAQEVAGVAWWAHVGGFVFGLLAGFVIRRTVKEETP